MFNTFFNKSYPIKFKKKNLFLLLIILNYIFSFWLEFSNFPPNRYTYIFLTFLPSILLFILQSFFNIPSSHPTSHFTFPIQPFLPSSYNSYSYIHINSLTNLWAPFSCAPGALGIKQNLGMLLDIGQGFCFWQLIYTRFHFM